MKIEINENTDITRLFEEDSPYSHIHFKKGLYKHKIVVKKNGLTISGEVGVIISNNDYYHKIHRDNKEYNTFRTYTMKVIANDVTLENVTIENTCRPSSKYGQAVALHVIGNNFTCKNCHLIGAQDTLFTGPLPKNLLIKYKDFLPDSELTGALSKQRYVNTTIYGDVDFIFGGSTAYFYNCKIVCIGNKGYICAPSHYQEFKYGYLFHNCNIESLNPEPNYYLARPWRDYGSVAFINCNIGNHILPIGFNDWGIPNRQKTCRFYEYSPNIDTSSRASYAKQLSKKEADEYIEEFLKYLNE